MAESKVNLLTPVAAVLGLFVSAFFLLALLSYSPLDGAAGIQNWAGPAGHYPTHYLIRLVGIASMPLVLLPGVLGLTALRSSTLSRWVRGRQALGFSLATTALAGFAQLFVKTIHLRGSAIDAGGWLGERIGSFALQLANRPGAFVLLLALMFVGTVLLTPKAAAVGVRLLVQGTLGSFRWLRAATGALAAYLRHRLDQKRKHKESIAKLAETASLRQREAQPQRNSDTKPANEKPLVLTKPAKVEIRKREAPKLQQQLKIPVKAGKFDLPQLDFLQYKPSSAAGIDRRSLELNSRLLEKKLADFGVRANVVAVQPGPVVTMYELEPAPGVKVQKFVSLADDLALAMRAVSIRVVAPIPGKNVVGIEIPNHERETVYLKEIIGSPAFQDGKLRIPIALGKDITGQPVVSDLAQMPHLLVAGSTGSGKSVSVNAMICSILYRFTPEQVKFVMIDPKMIELSAYDGIPHLRTPVITDPKKAAIALRRCVDEMERRYELMKAIGRAKDLETYNRRVADELKARGGKATLQIRSGEGSQASEETVELVPLPYWVIIIDELADLMTVAKKDIEDSIARLTAKARAAGLHLIVATQRPSVDVITGVIKSNLPTRLSFQVASAVDSKTILDSVGAENLLGQGDSLFVPPKTSRVVRVHGAFVSENEIADIVNFLRKQGQPEYDEALLKAKPGEEGDEAGTNSGADEERDPLYDQVLEFVLTSRRASTSAIQRKFSIGYNRAARILDQMEADGLVGPPNGSNPREILESRM